VGRSSIEGTSSGSPSRVEKVTALMILSFSQGDNAEMKVLIALNLGLKRLQKAFKLDGGRSGVWLYLRLLETVESP
jgi:hypothetical protein